MAVQGGRSRLYEHDTPRVDTCRHYDKSIAKCAGKDYRDGAVVPFERVWMLCVFGLIVLWGSPCYFLFGCKRLHTCRSDGQHHSDPSARHEHTKRQTKHVRHLKTTCRARVCVCLCVCVCYLGSSNCIVWLQCLDHSALTASIMHVLT